MTEENIRPENLDSSNEHVEESSLCEDKLTKQRKPKSASENVSIHTSAVDCETDKNANQSRKSTPQSGSKRRREEKLDLSSLLDDPDFIKQQMQMIRRARQLTANEHGSYWGRERPRCIMIVLACKNIVKNTSTDRKKLILGDPDMLRLNALKENVYPCWGIYGCTQRACSDGEDGRWHIECRNFASNRESDENMCLILYFPFCSWKHDSKPADKCVRITFYDQVHSRLLETSFVYIGIQTQALSCLITFGFKKMFIVSGLYCNCLFSHGFNIKSLYIY